jgi:predicted  nucleic acid-binding Zn-ribbon protein
MPIRGNAMVEHVDQILATHERAAAKAAAKAKELKDLNALHTKALAQVDQIEKKIETVASELTAIYNTDKAELSLANTA